MKTNKLSNLLIILFLFFAFFKISIISFGQSCEIKPKSSDWSLYGKGEKKTLASGDVELSVFPSAKSFGYWLSSPIPIKPHSVYQLQFEMLASNNNGSPEVGLTSYNEHLGWWIPKNKWTKYKFIFQAPDRIIPERSALRFGQYGMSSGKIKYRRICISRLMPKYRRFGSLQLGTGEIIYDNRYQFITRFLINGNHSRPLKSFLCAFNTNRWVFFKNDYVVYEHYLPGVVQKSGRVELHIDWQKTGRIILEVRTSKTKNHWQKIGQVSKPGEISFVIPKNYYPASKVEMRLRQVAGSSFKGDFDPGTIQVGVYRYFATLNKTFDKILKGKTFYEDK